MSNEAMELLNVPANLIAANISKHRERERRIAGKPACQIKTSGT